MAEAFLTRLPRVGRGILPPEDQRCPICMEDYGTTPSPNGTIERAVKLPCNHILGSECISLWLLSSPPPHGGGNNTCPLCRRLLFHAQPTPPTLLSRVGHLRIHALLVGRVLGICAQLDLNTDVTHMARWVVNHFHDRVRLEVTDPNGRVIDAVAAAAAYMACCVLGEGRDLDVIAGCVEVGDAAIGCAYVLLHGCRHDLFDRQLLARRGIALGAIDEVLPPGLA